VVGVCFIVETDVDKLPYHQFSALAAAGLSPGKFYKRGSQEKYLACG
jgi:hypothetical protein